MTPDQREDMDRELEHLKRQDMKWHTLNRRTSWWLRHSEEVGMFLWIIAITMMGAMLWLVYGNWPR